MKDFLPGKPVGIILGNKVYEQSGPINSRCRRLPPPRLPTRSPCCRCVLSFHLRRNSSCDTANNLGTSQETRLLQLCLRLLSSRLAAGSVVDELTVTEKMKKQASLQKDSRASLQLQDYLGRLKQKHILTRRLQVLCVLANLSFSPDSASPSYVPLLTHAAQASHCSVMYRSLFLRYLLLRHAWKSAILLQSLRHQHLLLAQTKTSLWTQCPKLRFYATACLLCTASMARCSFALI